MIWEGGGPAASSVALPGALGKRIAALNGKQGTLTLDDAIFHSIRAGAHDVALIDWSDESTEMLRYDVTDVFEDAEGFSDALVPFALLPPEGWDAILLLDTSRSTGSDCPVKLFHIAAYEFYDLADSFAELKLEV